MLILTTTLAKMLELFLFILTGFILRKKNYLPDNSGEVLSKLENHVLMPALIISTFATRCTLDNLITKWNLVVWEIVIIIITVIIAVVTSKILSKDVTSEKIIRYGIVVPNFAFMGNAVVEGVFGDDMLYNYMILTIPLNIFAYTIGVMWLMPDKLEGKAKKGKINAIFVSLIIGIVLGISKIPVPAFLLQTLESAGRCMAPVAMILTGFIIGGYKIKSMLSDINLYVLTTLRLIIIPTLIYFILNIAGVNEQLKTLAVVTLAMPFGLNTIIITAAYGGDTKRGAAMTLVSHVAAIISIPVILTVTLN